MALLAIGLWQKQAAVAAVGFAILFVFGVRDVTDYIQRESAGRDA